MYRYENEHIQARAVNVVTVQKRFLPSSSFFLNSVLFDRHAKEPVASMAIPLGAHQDASKGHGAVKAPRPTLVDSSTEANAVRADGSHNSLDLGSKVRAPAPLHMPHVA